MAETLTRGTWYTLSTGCPHCGEVQAMYLLKLRQTTEEITVQRCRCLFQCRGCHASRTMTFRDSGASPEKPVSQIL